MLLLLKLPSRNSLQLYNHINNIYLIYDLTSVLSVLPSEILLILYLYIWFPSALSMVFLFIYLYLNDFKLFDKQLHATLYSNAVFCSVCNPSQAGINGKCHHHLMLPSSKPVKRWTTRPKVWCLGTFQWNAPLALQKTMSRLLYCFSGISTSILRPLCL